MDNIDKEIDEMQRIIEGRCPSCNTVDGGSNVDDDDNGTIYGHLPNCIRSFGGTRGITYISRYHTRNKTCLISWSEQDKDRHMCSKKDYDFLVSTRNAAQSFCYNTNEFDNLYWELEDDG